MRRVRWTWLIVIIPWLAAACAGPQPSTGADPIQKTGVQVTQELRPSVTPSPTNAGPADSTPTVIPESSPTATATAIPPTAIPFQICSPLSIHALDELREIISDPYRPPPPGREERHHGVDFSYYRRGERMTIQGVGVQSVLPGIVAASLPETYPYGNLVIIETPQDTLPAELRSQLGMAEGDSVYSLYAHLDRPPLVALGEQVEACQPLGEVGVSGNAVEPHLHLEMRLGPAGATFASMAYYGTRDSEEARSNYVRWRTGGEFRHFDPMSVLYTDFTD